MLTGTGLSLSQIATRTDFGQSAAFTRSFRVRSGMSPSEYRRRYQAVGSWPAVQQPSNDGSPEPI
jgi:transcriptional regulator GlxA family with amidase domain